MKVWSVALAREAETWPQVSMCPFFGFTALYRKERIFALLPRTRALETSSSLAFKLESPPSRVLIELQQDPRVGSAEMQRARWFTFALSTAADLRGAIRWIERAYEAARTRKQKRLP
jgi:predicted DNA-binding protein (MmcQ/YjbR family)